MLKLNHTELRSFFYGTLLGDSYFPTHPQGYAFSCRQITKTLVKFKEGVIQQYLPDVQTRFYIKESYIDRNGVNHAEAYTLTASHSQYLRKMKSLFYNDEGKKYVKEGIIKKLTPLGYAMWFADDGTTVLRKHLSSRGSSTGRYIQFCTDSFTINEVERISSELPYDSSIVFTSKHNPRIQLTTQSAQLFMCDIEPFFYYFPELLYKLDLGYRNDSLKDRRYVSKEYEELFLRISAHSSFIDRLKGL